MMGAATVLARAGRSISLPVVGVISTKENPPYPTESINAKDVKLIAGYGGRMRETRIPERRCYWRPTQSPTEFYDGFSIHFNSTPPKYHNRFDNRATELRAKVHAKRRLAKGKRK